jgi:hypothetical protein
MNNSDEKKHFKCLLIKTDNNIQDVIFDFKDNNAKNYLNCDMTEHETLNYLNNFGYKCRVISKDISISNDKINKIASLICIKQRQNGNSVYGDVLLVDDKKDLTKEDLSKIMRVAFNIDYENNTITIPMITSDDFIHTSDNNDISFVGDKYKKKWIQLPQKLGNTRCNVLADCKTKCDCGTHLTTLYILEGKYMTMQCKKVNGWAWMLKPKNKSVSQIVKEQTC